MPKRAARVITAAFSESSESDDSDDEKASEDSDSEQEVEVVTTVSGTPLASPAHPEPTWVVSGPPST